MYFYESVSGGFFVCLFGRLVGWLVGSSNEQKQTLVYLRQK